jgi:hypothetical protein
VGQFDLPGELRALCGEAFDLIPRNSKAITAKNAKNFRKVSQENQTDPPPTGQPFLRIMFILTLS